MNELQTDFLVPDLHCPTCVSHIESALSELKPLSVTCSLVSHTVTVRHYTSLDAATISSALGSVGYEVDSVLRNGVLVGPHVTASPKSSGLFAQFSPKSNRSIESERRERQRIHLQNCELCRKGSLHGPSSVSSLAIHPLQNVEVETAQPEKSEAHLSVNGMTCSSCVASVTNALKSRPWVQSVNVNLLTNSASAVVEGKDRSAQLVEIIEDLGYEAAVDQVNKVQLREVIDNQLGEQLWRASFSIGGMTCSSCVETVTSALKSLPWTQDASVNLLNANATVNFSDRKHIPEILASVDNVGYDATLVDLVELSKLDSDKNIRSVHIHVKGLFCEQCPTRITSALEALNTSVTLEKAPSLTDPILRVTYIPNPPDFTVRHILQRIGLIDPGFEPTIYKPPTLEERARAMHSRERWQVLYRMLISLVAAIPSFIIGIVFMSLVPDTNSSREYLMKRWAHVPRAQWALFIISTPVYSCAADLFHRRALKEVYVLWRPRSTTPMLRRFFRFGSMNLLMSLGTSIAYFSSIVELILVSQHSDMQSQGSFYFDSVVFLTLFLLIGRLLEAWSKAKTGDAVAILGKLRPSEAIHVGQKDGEDSIQKVQVEALEIGDTVQVPHGSSPPCDGIILKGQGRFDESSLTGESRLIAKTVGEDVFSGTINQGNPVLVRATKLAGSSMLDQVIQVVREGQARRAPIERIADKITSYFVPLITLIAIITWIIWLALGESGALPRDWLDIQSGGWPFWSLQFAIAVFIIACPCGIGLAAPTALFVGSGLAAKSGILVKGGGEAFQESSQLDIIVFDKTGTLTQGGEPSITDHDYLGMSDQIEKHLLLSMVKALEENSSHPLAKAVTTFLRDENRDVHSDTIEEIPGHGLKGTFTSAAHPAKSFTVLVGNESLLLERNIPIERPILESLNGWKKEAKSVILAAVCIQDADNSLTEWTIPVIMAASDPLRPESSTVVNDLQQRGIAVWMVTGDNPTTAIAIGKSVGIPTGNIIAGVLPEQKAKEIQYLQKSQTKTSKRIFSSRKRETNVRATVAMVGDGVNDSPALTVADVGIAIGSGSDVAISSADFVLISAHLSAIPLLLDLSRKVFTRIKFNFGWALIYNLIALPIAAGVLYPINSNGNHIRLDPVWASLAMALSSISVVTSSLALKTKLPYVGIKKLQSIGDKEEKRLSVWCWTELPSILCP